VKPSTLRLLLAAAAATATSAALGGGAETAGSFLPALGAMVLLGGWLEAQTERPDAAAALALLLLVPAVGARMWGQLNAEIDLPHLEPTQAAQLLPLLAASSLKGVPGHLAGAGAALLVLGHRRLSAPALAGAIAAGLSHMMLRGCAGALDGSLWAEAALWARASIWAPGLVAVLFVFSPRAPRREAGLWIALVCCVGSVSISPLPRFLSVFTPTVTAEVLPSGAPGLPATGTAISEGAAGWAAGLEAAGLPIFRSDGTRWCQPEHRWGRQMRLSVLVVAPAEQTIEALVPLFVAMHQRSIGQLSLQGSGPALGGMRGATLGHPTATFVLDPPPERVATGILEESGSVRWVDGEPEDGLCLLRAAGSVSVQALYDAGRALGDPGGVCARTLGLDVQWALPVCP
jgi:hypothetical protein